MNHVLHNLPNIIRYFLYYINVTLKTVFYRSKKMLGYVVFFYKVLEMK